MGRRRVPATRRRGRDWPRRHLRLSLDTPQDAVVIVQASRCEPWKGHQLLLDALSSDYVPGSLLQAAWQPPRMAGSNGKVSLPSTMTAMRSAMLRASF